MDGRGRARGASGELAPSERRSPLPNAVAFPAARRSLRRSLSICTSEQCKESKGVDVLLTLSLEMTILTLVPSSSGRTVLKSGKGSLVDINTLEIA